VTARKVENAAQYSRAKVSQQAIGSKTAEERKRLRRTPVDAR